MAQTPLYEGFIMWAQNFKNEGIFERVIAIDGKTIRGSKDSFHHKSPLHSVHAWSVENGVCLGQMQCGEKTNEITTIPKILDLFNITGSIVFFAERERSWMFRIFNFRK
ncbi:MAG: ISAs1 family transposase [Bacteroidales bacterium]|nr:ISAs1 family transposase [Bacteroidales bacterium]